MENAREIKLADVAACFARIDIEFQNFHGKLFSFILPEPSRLQKILEGAKFSRDAFPDRHPATVVVGKLAPLVRIQSKVAMGSANQILQVSFAVSDLKLPDHDYLALISPVAMSESGTNYGRAYNSISFLRSLISLPFGKLASYNWIADFDFDSKGKINLPGEAVRMPIHADLFKFIDQHLISELVSRLALQGSELRQRMQRACNFFDMAMNQTNEAFRFASYWIALEIIVGGKSDSIRAQLADAYGEKKKSFADDHLCFKEISDVRHALMHKGQFGVLPSYHERLLQLYFWDDLPLRNSSRSD
ncbi:MAG: hypothetical protein FJX48_06535 [Alphaproteobacteria bacterium]|nr:hypothetical protein [Alphaproteobacteria bacterium]